MRFFSLFTSSLFLFISVFSSVVSASVIKNQTFEVSAYYSPVPNQDAYVLGSYAADVRMNGNGTHGSDGTEVYVGMISAPKIYDFGTKIYIPGFGVGAVHDRGGAIYATKNYHRLDIWMGYGDEGRKRALQWGRKIVEGAIVSSDTKEEVVLNGVDFERSVEGYMERDDAFYTNLWFKMDSSSFAVQEEIKRVQEFLGCEITGKYDSQTSYAVYYFQVENGILTYKNDIGAGTWGPKTREVANILVLEAKEESLVSPSTLSLSTAEITRK